ncbi:MAG TPA: MFS transporter [Streptosporangiaceae bacterium]|jgi:EmrB/QacA subfamily drug resistance transporter|nr:MFS transporter [Streptosporangiaceae bacterium]
MATQDTSAAQVTGTSATDDPNYPRRWWILAILGLAQLMVVLDVTIVNIALPHAQASLAFSNTDRQWIVTGYSLAFGSLLLLGGRIADNFGRKRVFLIGIVGFAAASAFGGAAQNFDMLLAARVLQGAFGALLAPATLSLLTTTFTDPQERTKATGIYGGIAGAGASVGLLLGGFLTQYLDWRWVMYVNVVLAAFALAGGGTLLKNVPSLHRPKLDLVGTVLAAAGLFCLVFGFSNASMSTGSSGWTKPGTLGTLIGGVVLLIAFVLAEQRVANPLLPLRVVLDRNRGGAYMAMFLAAIGMFGVFLFLTYYLEETLQWSAVKTGVAFLPLTLILVVVAAVGNTILLTRISPRIAVPIGLVLAGVGMALLTRIGLHSNYAADVLPTLLLLGVGLGLVFAPAFTLGTLGVDRDDAGVASASINVAQQIGGSIGTSLLNTIAATAATGYATAHAASITSSASKQLVEANSLIHSYHVVFWVAAAVFIGASVLAALVLRSGVAIPREGSGTPAVHA